MPEDRRPFLLYAALTLQFGAINALIGPVLPELADQAGLDDADLAVVFLVRGAGSVLGAIAAGAALDRVSDPHAVLWPSLVVRSGAALLVPLATSRAALAGGLGLVAFGANAVSTVGSTCVAWTYGKLMGPQTNVMNGMFGLGSIFAPVLAEALALLGAEAVCGYWLLAALDVVFLAATLSISATPNPVLAVASGDGADAKELHVNTVACVLAGASMFFGNSAEAAGQFWSYTYATKYLGLAHGPARALLSAYFTAYTAMRFFLGWASMHIRARTILRASILCAGGFSALLLSAGSAVGVPLGSVALIGIALGVAGLYANTQVALREVSFLTGQVQSMLRVGAACGTAAGTSAIGFLAHALGAATLPGVVLGSLAGKVVLLELLFCQDAVV